MRADMQMRVKTEIFRGLNLGYTEFLDFCFGVLDQSIPVWGNFGPFYKKKTLKTY